MGRKNVVWRTPDITADGLKIFACIAMLIQTIGIVIVENGLIDLSQYTQESLSTALETDSNLMMLAGVGSVMQLIGGLAIPLFAFLLVEGFLHTSDVKKYLRNIAVFALVSEIPYDLAMSGKVLDFSSQNALISMAVGLIMLILLKTLKEQSGVAALIGRIAVILGAVAWVTLFRAQYGFCIVLLTAVFYLCYTRTVLMTVLGMLVSLLYVTGPLAFYGIWCYNEERKERLPKYAYYVFYPAHLLVCALIVKVFM